MNALYVVSSGMLTLIQDLGRQKVGHLGLSAGGPADVHAFCWANRLVGNRSDRPALEITFGKVILRAQCDVMLALTGAEMSASIDGIAIGNWRSFLLKQGQELKLGYAKKGFRAYLAIQNGINVPKSYGSAATVVRNQLGGLAQSPGRALQEGDSFGNGNSVNEILEPKFVPPRFIPQYHQDVKIGVFETYQANLFPKKQKNKFYSNAYAVSDKLDRMGIRLQGEAIFAEREGQPVKGILSEGIAHGSIQFPPNGQPIILINDRQTLGGYPKLGCVSKMSLMRLAQARPGVNLHFYPADMAQETENYVKFLKFFDI
ncbi:biotin-dependent carboxyltransferase family protein [Vibrio hibernica]|uniref:5-oxoprolinase subunit C family protein n=1 Tax=Vibrio hibernica TaxID=2587465 RepID=UPI0039B0CEC2